MPFNLPRFTTYLEEADGAVLRREYDQVSRYIEIGVAPNGGQRLSVDTLIQASEGQIDIGEKFLRDQEEVHYTADQTGTGEPFDLISDEGANQLIKDGENMLIAAELYKYLVGDREPDEIITRFMRKAGIDLLDERDRLREIYGNRVPDVDKDPTNVEEPEVDVSKQFVRRGW